MNVGHNATVSDGDVTKKLAQFFVVPHRQLNVARHNSSLLIVSRSVSSQLQNLGCEIFEDSGEVNGSTGADALGVFSGFEETGDTADGELEAGFAAP